MEAVRRVIFFRTKEGFRKWLEKNHNKEKEIYLGHFRISSGKESISYNEALDEALCYGWIDGIRHKIDEESYSTRFTPRRKGSIWSIKNIDHVKRLMKEGRIEPSGLKAYEAKIKEKTGVYSLEQRNVKFDEETEKSFRKHKAAWEFFEGKAPSYRRVATWWVMSAKRPETKERRLRQVIDDSEKNAKLQWMEKWKKK